MSTTAFCTIVARNYLAYALTLLASVERHHPKAARYVLIVDGFDRRAEPDLKQNQISAVCPLDLLPYEIATALAYAYDITEYSTALKPFFLNYLLDHGHESVVYLDPDIVVFGSLEREVLEPLSQAAVVLTPHCTDPIPLDGFMPNEVTLLRAGAYNLGFIGVRETEQTRRFLSWWSDRLERFCVNEVQSGLFVDQKWIDLVPGLFPGTRILFHRGLNVAYWNLYARSIVESSDGAPRLRCGSPLLFFHFSGFDPLTPNRLSRHQDRIDVAKSPALAKLLLDYTHDLAHWGHAQRRSAVYGHGTFSDGTRVDETVRAVCRAARESGVVFPDASDADARPSLLDFCQATDPSDPGGDPSDPRGAPRLTRYLTSLYASRPDLQLAFPDLRGAGRHAFFIWLKGDSNHTIDPAFVEAPFASPRERSRGLPVVNVAGYFSAESGVGEAGRAHIAGIQSAGYDVHLINFSSGAPGSRKGESVVDGLRLPGAVNLICVNADQVPIFTKSAGEALLAERYNIGSWWWELPEFPSRWHDRFEPFDEIWVGSEYVRTTIASVSPIPVFRVPPIVAPPPVRNPSKERFGLPRDAFVFLYFFDFLSIFERKNPLGIVAAFREAFGSAGEVKLVLKTINSGHDPENADKLRAACEDDPRIEIRESYLTRDEKNALIAAVDCYVSLHRSEGFGLTIAEAMYYGTPVICTGWSGNADFTNEGNALIIEGPLVRLERDYGPYAAGQCWADPDIGQAARAMRDVVEDRLNAFDRAAIAQADIRAHFSAQAVGAIARSRLSHILELGGARA